MPRYYLKVEAVNIDNFVYDTHDISTIRGGSYLLLDSIRSLQNKFERRLIPVATAASQGLFYFEPSGPDFDQACKDVRKDVLEHLHGATGGHATFVVALQKEIPENFRQTLAMLEAQARRQQWLLPTIAVPEQMPAARACYLDGWRPGINQYRVDPTVNDAWISEATSYRRKRGREIKHDIFFELLQDEQYLGQISAKDLGELAKDSAKGILNGKIAFVHLDGNNFGRIRRDFCKTSEDRSDFDKIIQDNIRNFIKALVVKAKSESDFQISTADSRKALRLEVLLLGGDEITLVVPAWKGWDVLRLFYENLQNLSFRDTLLTYRSTIVFCHHNAPLLLTRQLANDLLQETKKDIGEVSDPTLANAIHYLVLESFDLLQGDIQSFLSEYYKGGSYKSLLMQANQLDNILKSIHTIRSNVARGKALKIIESLKTHNMTAVKKIKENMIELIPAEYRHEIDSAISILTTPSEDRWYLVTDLWDYVAEA